MKSSSLRGRLKRIQGRDRSGLKKSTTTLPSLHLPIPLLNLSAPTLNGSNLSCIWPALSDSDTLKPSSNKGIQTNELTSQLIKMIYSVSYLLLSWGQHLCSRLPFSQSTSVALRLSCTTLTEHPNASCTISNTQVISSHFWCVNTDSHSFSSILHITVILVFLKMLILLPLLITSKVTDSTIFSGRMAHKSSSPAQISEFQTHNSHFSLDPP